MREQVDQVGRALRRANGPVRGLRPPGLATRRWQVATGAERIRTKGLRDVRIELRMERKFMRFLLYELSIGSMITANCPQVARTIECSCFSGLCEGRQAIVDHDADPLGALSWFGGDNVIATDRD